MQPVKKPVQTASTNKPTSSVKPTPHTPAANKSAEPQKVDFKTVAAGEKPEPQPVEKTPAAAPPKPEQKAAAPKQQEFVGEKLRTKADVIGALKKGGRLKIDNGLWRLIRVDGSKQRVSKRRAVVLRDQKVIVQEGEWYVLAPEAAKASEPK